MKLISLSYRNYKCFDELDIKPQLLPGKGSLTVISGGNEIGKTAILDGLIAVFDGGHRASDIRKGTKKATIELIVEEDGKQWSLLKKIVPSGSNLEVRPLLDGEKGEELPSPQAWAKGIASGIAFNPLDFIEDAAKRTAWLQKALPMEFTLAEMLAAVATGTAKQRLQDVWRSSGGPNGHVDLDGLIRIRERLAEIRKESSGRLKQIDGSIVTLRHALPPEGEAGEDWKSKLDAANAELSGVQREKGETLREVDAAEKDAISDAEKKRDATIAAARATFDQEYSRVQGEARAARASVDADYHDREMNLKSAQAIAQTNLQQASQQTAVRQEYERVRESRKAVEVEATALDDCVKALDDLRQNKAREMPIPGAEIRDGELYINGLPFEGNVSTSEQIKVALQFASLGNNPLPLIVIDRLESFEPARYEDLKQVIKASGFQVFGTRVTEGPLQVTHG